MANRSHGPLRTRSAFDTSTLGSSDDSSHDGDTPLPPPDAIALPPDTAVCKQNQALLTLDNRQLHDAVTNTPPAGSSVSLPSRDLHSRSSSTAPSKRNLLVYLTQALGCFFLMSIGAYNLTIDAPNKPLWTSLLVGPLGYLLPNPRLKNKKQPWLSGPLL